MSLNDFVNTWLGKRTDYDHVYQYQCVDLILQYLADCYGITSGVWGNAIDYWTNPTARLLQSFDRVQGAIQGGDIVILNGLPGNPYGHIMVAINSTTAIEQNGQTGDGSGTGGDSVRYRTIPTSRVAGLLRPKQGTDNMAIIQNADNWRARAQRSFQTIRGRDMGPGEFEPWIGQDFLHLVEALEDDQEANAQIDYANWGRTAKNDHWDQQIYALQAQVATLSQSIADLNSKLDSLASTVAQKDAQIKQLTDENTALKAQAGDPNLTIKQAIRVLWKTITDAVQGK